MNKELAMIAGHRSSLNIWCALIGITAGCLADGTVDRENMAAGRPPAVQGFSELSQADAIASVKPIPVKPPDQPGVITDGTLPEKPATSAAAEPTVPWTVSLVASTQSPWAGTYTTLTATTNMDVGPTPYFIRIWDDDAGEGGMYIASCGFGTSCSISVTRPRRSTTMFKAVVASNVTVASAFAGVYWHVSGVRLNETETTVANGSSVKLTAFSDYDVGPSPYWIQIHDDTARKVVGICGRGTACSVTVSQSAATTHRFRACFSEYSTTYPPSNILECTTQKPVTWTADPSLRVSLRASTNAVTATASIDVGPTPYWIHIFTIEGDRIALCGFGRTCTVPSTQFCPDVDLVGRIGLLNSTLDNATAESGPQATSRVLGLSPITMQGSPVAPCPRPSPGGEPAVFVPKK